MLREKMKYMSIILGGTLLFATGCTSQNTVIEKEEEIQEVKDDIITLSAVGDIMVHGAQLDAQFSENGTFNFDNNFKHIRNIIEDADLAIANLETTINIDRNVSGYPSFNSPKELLKTLKDTGFDVISTINNHTLDTGYSGVTSTLNELKVAGLKPVGTKSTVEEKNYLIENVDDIKMGITTFSYGDIKNSQKYLNGIPSGKASDLLNVMNSSDVQEAFETIKKEIDLMKQEGVEFIVVGLHWGEEYKQVPTNYQKELAQMLANEGVDLILGSHPHVVQPIEFIKSEVNENEETLVVYSMGNIISNQREEEMGFKESENGIIPLIDIEKTDDGTVTLKEVRYIPTWVNKDFRDGKAFYEIIPIDRDISQLAKEYNVSEEDLQISYNNTTALMSDERIKVYKKDV